VTTEPCLGQTVGQFLDALSAGTAAPGGGAAAALAVAFAAGLAGMTARLSDRQLPDARELATTADTLRGRAAALADEDAAAYLDLLAARSRPAATGAEHHRSAMHAALMRATAVPVAIAETAAEVAILADRLATGGNPNLRGDAVTGALLAEAAARAAATLVALNAAPGDLDQSWADRAEAAVRTAGDAARSAATPTGP
jgi:formiminotetrahydrofolate cyclodeaminase